MTLAVSHGAAETALLIATIARPDPAAAGELFEQMIRIWESLDAEMVHPTSTETPCHVAH